MLHIFLQRNSEGTCFSLSVFLTKELQMLCEHIIEAHLFLNIIYRKSEAGTGRIFFKKKMRSSRDLK